MKKIARDLKRACKWGFMPTSTQCALSVCNQECLKALKGTKFEGVKIKGD